MGMHNNDKSGGGMFFFSVINTNKGPMWARRVSADTEGAVAREAKCGLVHELYYSSVSGMIDSVRIIDKGQFGEELEITMLDDEGTDEKYILQTPFSSEIGRGFICRMENIDADYPVVVGLFSKNGKRYCYLKQDEKVIGNPYVKDGPKSLPAPKQISRRGGKVEWDWKEQEDELYSICERESIKNEWSRDADEFTLSNYVRPEKESDTDFDVEDEAI